MDKTKSQIPRNKFAKNGRNPKILEIVTILIKWLEDPRPAPKPFRISKNCSRFTQFG
jgi:hypothetical protein